MKSNVSFSCALYRTGAFALWFFSSSVLPTHAQPVTAAVECTVVRVYTHQPNGVGGESLRCESLDFSASYLLQDIPEGLEERYAEQILDGSLVIIFKGADTSSGNVSFSQVTEWAIRKPSDVREKNPLAKGDSGDASSPERFKISLGERSVLMVRVSAPAHPNTYTEAKLSDLVFGTSGDTINMVSQFSQCSFNQLSLVPTPDEQDQHQDYLIKDGVTSVMVDNEDVSDIELYSAMINARAPLISKLGSLDRFDLIMYALPAGITFGTAGVAAGKHSAYKDVWASSLSTHMHEVGHSLGLGHAGEGNGNYDDETGYMGRLQGGDNSPLRCYNGGKSSFLGWYEDKEFSTTYTPSFWSTKLYSLIDYEQIGSTNSIILKIESPAGSTENLYLSFNRSKSINSDTPLALKDRVNVVSDFQPGRQSFRLASLATGEEYTYPDFAGPGQDFVIKVGDIVINQDGVFDHAEVSVTAVRPESDELCMPVMAKNNRLVVICL